MIKINLKAKIRRNHLDTTVGEYFRDENSEIVRKLNYTNKKALLGIERNDGLYTIIGEEHVYYSTVLGAEGFIEHLFLLKILHQNALKLGKQGQFEFIQVNEDDFIWMLNAYTMNALWNTLLAITSGYK